MGPDIEGTRDSDQHEFKKRERGRDCEAYAAAGGARGIGQEGHVLLQDRRGTNTA